MNEKIMNKIVVDAARGGEDIGSSANEIIEKDYNLAISRYIFDRLKSLGIPVLLTRDSDETINITKRSNQIKETYGTGDKVIVISNTLTSNQEEPKITYALRNNDKLSLLIANELKKAGLNISKVHQRRLPSNNSLDYNQIIRDTRDNETIIISYGNINNKKEANLLRTKIKELGEAVVIALAKYLNINNIPSNGNNYYIVSKGDSLYSISKKTEVPIDSIKKINNLTSNLLQIGQILQIPNINSNTMKYKVISGDSLYNIAKKYNTTVDEIKKMNNLTTNALSIGTTLEIPIK